MKKSVHWSVCSLIIAGTGCCVIGKGPEYTGAMTESVIADPRSMNSSTLASSMTLSLSSSKMAVTTAGDIATTNSASVR